MRQGEYWITNDGNAMYADGDIGDYNHESYVIQQIQSQYAPDEYDRMEYVDWEQFEKDIAKQGYHKALAAARTPEEKKEVDEYWDSDDYLNQYFKNELGMSDDEIIIARGHSGIDPREFAIKHWGWKRVVDENIETWYATANDMTTIASGLWDAYQDSAERGKYNIYSYAYKRWFNEVPFYVLESGDVARLRQFGLRAETFELWLQRNYNIHS